ncbi:MAG TPA: hypothetical protein VMT30_04695 [Candidatus Saccharimonadia bacterium]|nr:hypothetical protein [Candidatus Saccharimonadia bacterium]
MRIRNSNARWVAGWVVVIGIGIAAGLLIVPHILDTLTGCSPADASFGLAGCIQDDYTFWHRVGVILVALVVIGVEGGVFLIWTSQPVERATYRLYCWLFHRRPTA